jgi:hypothetical protein
MRGNHWSWSVLALSAALAACDAGREEQVAAACTTICRCEAPPVPTIQDECVQECTAEVPAFVPEACLACVTSHADRCALIDVDCEPLCEVDNPDPEPDPLPPSPTVDAFVADPEPKEGL